MVSGRLRGGRGGDDTERLDAFTLVEQTYMLEGRLVDKDGPEAGLSIGPGEFVARPAGSRHSAWTPEGGLMIAVFQVPNKFYEKDGSVVDLMGDEWQAKWGHAL